MATYNGEELTIARLLPDIYNGFYVDVGANDVETSNSHRFYLHGWRGIEVEPIAELAAQLRKAHPQNQVFECAVGASIGKAQLLKLQNLGLSTLRYDIILRHIAKGYGPFELVEVDLRTLDDILTEAEVKDIDFMSIDVEGAEAALLAGLDLRKYRPRVMLLEAIIPDTDIPCWEEWQPIILAQGYKFIGTDDVNRFYVREEDAWRGKLFERINRV